MVSKKLGILIVLVIIAVFAGIGAMQMLKYTQSPEFCGECHVMTPYYLSWKTPKAPDDPDYALLDHHHGKGHVTCDECHLEPGVTVIEVAIHSITAEVLPYYMGTYELPLELHEAFPIENCIECHEDYKERTHHLVSDPHRIVTDCTVCHRAHPKVVEIPPMKPEQCGECHPAVYRGWRIEGGDHGILNCMYCHETHAYVPACQKCHSDFHGSELTSCSECHTDPHTIGRLDLRAVTSEECVICHAAVQGEVLETTSKHDGVQCSACHPEHEFEKTLACEVCHTTIEGHYPGLTLAECEQCHPTGHSEMPVVYKEDVPNEWCASCHAEPADLIKLAGKHAGLACAYCHTTHASIQTCEACHGTPHSAAMHAIGPCATCHVSAHELAI
ncbi:MAG: hypothetical protein QMC77_00630 [Methanocellales archaeon]|nr:hypothetical protein [Methanocellales archaeon]